MMLRTIVLLTIVFFSFSAVGYSKEKVDIASILSEVANSLDKQLIKKYGNTVRYIPMIVTTPVNLSNFSQTNSLARQFGQEILTQLVQKQYKVEEIRHTKDIRAFENVGEFILSRSPAIDNKYSVGLVVAGTYTITGIGVRFSAEVINISDSSIAAMESVTIPFSKEIEILLLQQSSTNGDAIEKSTPGNTSASQIQQQVGRIAPVTVFTVPNDVY